MLPNGCSWYETNHLGGCIRRSEKRPECYLPTKSAILSPHRLAVMVPYRRYDRTVALDDLAPLCARLAAPFHRAGSFFEIFVLNQVDARPFNRGALANAAVKSLWNQLRVSALMPSLLDKHSSRLRARAFDYLAIHDFDRYPIAEAQGTGCSASIDGYYAYTASSPRVLHPTSFAGGALITSFELYRSVNGFSNSYWGWGEEDNDLFVRLRWCGLPPVHGRHLDECMEHRDCAACKEQKNHLANSSALEEAKRRMRSRMRHPRKHMINDGMSTTNFTIVRQRELPGACGGATVTVMDIDLSGSFHPVQPVARDAFQPWWMVASPTSTVTV